MITLHRDNGQMLLVSYLGVEDFGDGELYRILWNQYVRHDGSLVRVGFFSTQDLNYARKKANRLQEAIESANGNNGGWTTMKLKDVLELQPIIKAYKIGDKTFEGGMEEIENG